MTTENDLGWHMNPDCHFGDHTYGDGATCRYCGHFNGGLLSWFRYEKAEREGRAHNGHFHRTLEAVVACRRKPDPEWESEPVR